MLSAHEDELGSGTGARTVPVGEVMTAKYYIQALGDSGAVTYKATADGFRHRIAKIGLAKSGFMVAYERYGPPDEAHVLRKGGAEDERRFYPSRPSQGHACESGPSIAPISIRPPACRRISPCNRSGLASRLS